MVVRFRASARRRGTVSSQEFSNPSGASHTMFQRSRNSRRTSVMVAAAEPGRLDRTEDETRPVPVYSG